MGCSNEPDAFMKVYNAKLEEWREDTKATISNLMLQSRAPKWDPVGPVPDASRQVLVDDILKFHIAIRVGTEKQAMDAQSNLHDATTTVNDALAMIIERDLDSLRRHLRTGGFGLNESKEEIVHSIPSKLQHRAFFDDNRINCRKLTSMKHVGGMFDGKDTFGAD
jgi:hypothetical protein